MRIYVLISSMKPMRLHLYKEGIVRFSSERYDTNQLGNHFSHLTNSSINKHAFGGGCGGNNVGGQYGSGIKWSFDQLRVYCRDNAISYEQMWVRIEQIILLTCINYCPIVPHSNTCLELLGFDVMLDSNLKPWLIEVNSSPALSIDGFIDSVVKPSLIRDTINMCNFEPRAERTEEKKTFFNRRIPT